MESSKDQLDIDLMKADAEQKKITTELLKRQMKGNVWKDILPLATIFVTLIGALINAYVQTKSIDASVKNATFSSTVMAKQHGYSILFQSLDNMYNAHLYKKDTVSNYADTIMKAYYELEFFIPEAKRQDIYQNLQSLIEYNSKQTQDKVFIDYSALRAEFRQNVLDALR